MASSTLMLYTYSYFININKRLSKRFCAIVYIGATRVVGGGLSPLNISIALPDEKY
jgi:hypothetical protein